MTFKKQITLQMHLTFNFNDLISSEMSMKFYSWIMNINAWLDSPWTPAIDNIHALWLKFILLRSSKVI